MQKPKADSSDWSARNNKNTVLLGYLTGAWLVTMAILVNMVIGFGIILAKKRRLKGLDEMQQKILLEAMALSLGVGLVVGLSYSLLDITNIISYATEISNLVIVMTLTFLAGASAGFRRYQ